MTLSCPTEGEPIQHWCVSPHPVSSNASDSAQHEYGREPCTSTDLNMSSKMSILNFKTALTLAVLLLNSSKGGVIHSNSTLMSHGTNSYDTTTGG